MKKIPRAEISTIKQMLYPDRKKSQREWNKKHLKSLKDLEEKNKKIKEEKKNFISPEPYKIQKFKNIPSKLKADTLNWINREHTINKILPKTPSITQKKNFMNNRTKINALSPINKPMTSNNEVRPNIINKTEDLDGENIYNILNNKTTTMFDRYYANKLKEKNMEYRNNNINNINNNNINNQLYSENINNINNNNYNTNQININQINPNQINPNQINSNQIYTYQMNSENNILPNDANNLNKINTENNFSRNEMIEKLIKEYKEKYGSDEALENMINEYYGKPKSNKEENIINNNYNNNRGFKSQNNSNNNSKYILPKIQKNYIRENRQLVIDNKVPIKHKQKEEPIIKADKHKDYGKVPSYIKKYEKEREIKNEEIKRLEEASKYPKGTKLLSEEERLNTLNGLIRNKKELINQLERMPITTRTNSVKLKKEELVKKLEEIEKAIDMFSRKQVFIKI